MDDQPTEGHRTEDKKKSISLTFTSDDIKLLVITFAGTVAANMLTVVLVGLAIAAARVFILPTSGIGTRCFSSSPSQPLYI